MTVKSYNHFSKIDSIHTVFGMKINDKTGRVSMHWKIPKKYWQIAVDMFEKVQIETNDPFMEIRLNQFEQPLTILIKADTNWGRLNEKMKAFKMELSSIGTLRGQEVLSEMRKDLINETCFKVRRLHAIITDRIRINFYSDRVRDNLTIKTEDSIEDSIVYEINEDLHF